MASVNIVKYLFVVPGEMTGVCFWYVGTFPCLPLLYKGKQILFSVYFHGR